jgi:hypothetical protein
MNSNILAAAQQEARELEAQIAATPLGQRLAAVRKVIEVYTPPHPATGLNMMVNALTQYVDGTIARTKTAEIQTGAMEFLRTRGRRATSTEIAPALVAKGITWGGDNSPQHLSSYLSTAKHLFDNDSARGGYGLLEWTTNRLEAAMNAPIPNSPPVRHG